MHYRAKSAETVGREIDAGAPTIFPRFFGILPHVSRIQAAGGGSALVHFEIV